MNGRCISQIERAQRWQLSESTLEHWCSEGIGPVFLKLRGQVRYRDTDILAYEHQALHASTRYRAGAAPSHARGAQCGALLPAAGSCCPMAEVGRDCGRLRGSRLLNSTQPSHCTHQPGSRTRNCHHGYLGASNLAKAK